MTIKIYGPILSTCVARVVVTLFEKDVTDYEFVEVDMPNSAHKKSEYLAIQPFGKVPAMADGSLTLFESRAIARFLSHKFEGQGTSLFGSSPKDRALVEQWLEVESQNFNPPVSGILHEKVGKELFMGMKADEAAVSAHIAKVGKVLDVYEARLTDSKYLAGDFFSLADLSHIPNLSTLIHYIKQGDVVEARPHVKAWWEDISSRPAWKKVYDMIQHDMVLFEASNKAK